MASDRLFIPPRIGNSTMGDILFRKRGNTFTHIRQRRGGQVRQGEHIAVCAAGACHGNGKPWAKAASGVYFGPGSPHNFTEEIEKGEHTIQRAEINAAFVALDSIRELLDEEKLDANLVLILTDSKYVVDGITRHVYRWQDNGWKNTRGSEVVNKDDFEELDEIVDELEDEFGVFVKFWQISKEENDHAIVLARTAAGFYDEDATNRSQSGKLSRA